MSREITACPECDKTQIQRRVGRVGGRQRKGDPGHDWRCVDCAATFDEPVRRPVHADSGITAQAMLSRLGVSVDE